MLSPIISNIFTRKIIRYAYCSIFFMCFLFSTFSQSNTTTSGDTCEPLKILSWNIYMLPHLIMHTGQAQRAKEIAETLKKEDVDVIVFQEAFDKRSRKIIREELKKYFPFESGNPKKNVFYKTNSGVWIVSKIPIKIVKRIYFKNGVGSDKFACKGALLIEAKKNDFCFQLVATHLQSDLKNKDVREARKMQYLKIRQKLLDPYANKNIPQFVVGDMNTSLEDSSSFQQMLGIFSMKQCAFENKACYSYDCSKNDLILDRKIKPQLLDYIFYNRKNHRAIEGTLLLKIFKKKWNSLHSDLSDHFAVLGTFHLTSIPGH